MCILLFWGGGVDRVVLFRSSCFLANLYRSLVPYWQWYYITVSLFLPSLLPVFALCTVISTVWCAHVYNSYIIFMLTLLGIWGFFPAPHTASSEFHRELDSGKHIHSLLSLPTSLLCSGGGRLGKELCCFQVEVEFQSPTVVPTDIMGFGAFITIQWKEVPAPHMFLTTPLVAWQGWEFRFPTQPLLSWVGVCACIFCGVRPE